MKKYAENFDFLQRGAAALGPAQKQLGLAAEAALANEPGPKAMHCNPAQSKYNWSSGTNTN